MSVRQWLLSGALLAVGCATSAVSDRDIARLPADERAQVATAQQSIDIAQSNLAAAKQARDEAKQFRKVAAGELDAAKSKLDAARGGVDLGKSTRDERTLREAGRTEDAARDQQIAARAKLDYADRLVELRDAKVAEAEANLAAARADVDVTKYRFVAQHDGDVKIDGRKLEATRQAAQERLAAERARVASLEGDVAQLKTAWDDRRRESHTASRSEVRALQPQAQPFPGREPFDVRGEVNDNPGAPANPQSQEPPNNIAPAP